MDTSCIDEQSVSGVEGSKVKTIETVFIEEDDIIAKRDRHVQLGNHNESQLLMNCTSHLL